MSWQKWDNKEFRRFLKEFYRDIFELASAIGMVIYDDGDKGMPIDIAIFEKIAPPAVYLRDEYERYLRKRKPKETKLEIKDIA